MSTYKLYTADNLELMKDYIAENGEGQVDLIYIDPPFNSKRNYLMSDGKVAFTDIWSNVSYLDELEEINTINPNLYSFLKNLESTGLQKSMLSYLTAMGIRLYYMRLLLKDTGSIYVHCDDAIGHYLKVVLDYIFGVNNFKNHISWKRSNKNKSSKDKFPRNTDIIFFYTKSSNSVFNLQYKGLTDDEKKKKFKYKDNVGRYSLQPIDNPGGGGAVFNYKGYPVPSRGYGCTLETMKKWDEQGLIHYPDSKTKQLKKKNYEQTNKGILVDDNWEYFSIKSNYPTQKPEALLERIIKASSNPGDLVMDLYNGGGTTGAVCKRLDRNYLGCDINDDAITLTQKRLEDLGCKLNKDLFVNN